MQIIIIIALLIIAGFSIIKKNESNKKLGPLSEEEKRSLLEGQERSRIIREAAKRREENPSFQKDDLECPNCGAPLKEIYAPCEFCGARCRVKKDNSVPELDPR